jgi:antitoxin MazE
MTEGAEVETVGGERCSEIARDKGRKEALARLKALKRPLPKGFKFDRAEANER